MKDFPFLRVYAYNINMKLGTCLCILAGLFLMNTAAVHAEVTSCFMYGMLANKVNEKTKTKFDDNIRLRFDATTKKKCKTMLGSYCRYDIPKEYSPRNLKAYFRSEKGEKTDFRISDKCIVTDEDDD